jgi:hypothetical protein
MELIYFSSSLLSSFLLKTTLQVLGGQNRVNQNSNNGFTFYHQFQMLKLALDNNDTKIESNSLSSYEQDFQCSNNSLIDLPKLWENKSFYITESFLENRFLFIFSILVPSTIIPQSLLKKMFFFLVFKKRCWLFDWKEW